MKRSFDEQDETELTAEAKAKAEFDWNELMSALEEVAVTDPEEIHDAAVVLNAILTWCFMPAERKTGSAHNKLAMVGRRVAALLWVIGPERFGDASLTRFAAQFGIHKAVMSEIASEFSKRFNIRNKKQEHGWNYKQTQKK